MCSKGIIKLHNNKKNHSLGIFALQTKAAKQFSENDYQHITGLDLQQENTVEAKGIQYLIWTAYFLSKYIKTFIFGKSNKV